MDKIDIFKDLSSGDVQIEQMKLIADIVTDMWRIHLVRPGVKADPQRELDSVLHTIESFWRRMAGRDIVVKDHTGEVLAGGEAFRIIAYQPLKELPRATVIETLRPTIYFKGKIIQMGDVIVGTPEK